MSDKYKDSPLTSYGEPIKNVEACVTAQAERAKSLHLLQRKANELFRQAQEMENLAKLIDVLPKEIEAALYPLIENYLYNGNK